MKGNVTTPLIFRLMMLLKCIILARQEKKIGAFAFCAIGMYWTSP